MYRRTSAVAIAVVVAGAIPAAGSPVGAIAPPAASAATSAAQTGAGSFALSGAAADAYRLPRDVVKVGRTALPDGSVSLRYQQMVGRASVLNGQITVLRAADGSRKAVFGSHYPGLRPAKAASLSPREAIDKAVRRHGARGQESVDLRIDPRNGRLFYAVDQIRPANRWITWVDAATANVRHTFNAVTEGRGVGVKNDRKRIETVFRRGAWRMRSTDSNGADTIGDSRQLTRNARGIFRYGGKVLFDQDNVWNRRAFRYRHPDQRPGVDAHYYADVVDDYFADVYGRNSIDDEGMTIRSTVHFGKNYCNAFWNGEQMTYGDGNGTTCKPLSGGLDVVGHELTHGVTDFSSELIYEYESGALNEAFSDMMGNSIEFYADAEGRDPAATPDWRIGEDVIDVYDNPGFRNMADPQEFGDPDHYAERYKGEDDNGGVHTNSGIPNHAYYLLVNGGKNAGCTGSGDEHTHTRGCGITVEGIGLAETEQIFYQAFTGLTEYANMCDARNATVALGGYQGFGANVSDAWAAVGVRGGCTGGVPPPPPCTSDSDAELPFGTPHPYGNEGDCTWVYDNGSAGFQFRFSLLDTEEGYDYVYVKDAAGNVLDTYSGTYDVPMYSSCIPTATGVVQFVSDAGVKDEGFTVDAVRAC
jgi:Zn-dependent metalloprotease